MRGKITQFIGDIEIYCRLFLFYGVIFSIFASKMFKMMPQR